MMLCIARKNQVDMTTEPSGVLTGEGDGETGRGEVETESKRTDGETWRGEVARQREKGETEREKTLHVKK